MSRSTASDAREIAALREEVTALREDVAALKGQNESLRSDVRELFTRVGAVNQKVDDQRTATSCSGTPVAASRAKRPTAAKAPATRSAATPNGKARCMALTQAGNQCSKPGAKETQFCPSHKDYKGKLVDLSGVAEAPDSSTKGEGAVPTGNPPAVAGNVPKSRSGRGVPASDPARLAVVRKALAEARAKAAAEAEADGGSHHGDSDGHGSSRGAAAAGSRQPESAGSDYEGDAVGGSDDGHDTGVFD